MIEFYGELSKKCRQYIWVERHKGVKVIALTIGGIFIIPLIGLSFLGKYAPMITIPFIVILIGYMISISSIKTKSFKKDFINSLPNTIRIQRETIETSGVGGISYKSVNIRDIKEIWDMGTFYAVIFYFPNMDRRFVCQKDLIVEGTIEEFEKLFENKIVRKYEKRD